MFTGPPAGRQGDVCVCVCVSWSPVLSPQAPVETAHAGCQFENLVCCPENMVAGTKEGDRTRGPVGKT